MTLFSTKSVVYESVDPRDFALAQPDPKYYLAIKLPTGYLYWNGNGSPMLAGSYSSQPTKMSAVSLAVAQDRLAEFQKQLPGSGYTPSLVPVAEAEQAMRVVKALLDGEDRAPERHEFKAAFTQPDESLDWVDLPEAKTLRDAYACARYELAERAKGTTFQVGEYVDDKWVPLRENWVPQGAPMPQGESLDPKDFIMGMVTVQAVAEKYGLAPDGAP